MLSVTFKKNKRNSGFALLMTILVVSVVISTGIAMLSLSLKQVELSSQATQSEIAFHAANAGAECAKFWRRDLSDEVEAGQNMNNVKCFTENAANMQRNSVPGGVTQYTYDFTWGTGMATRCTKINMIAMKTDVTSASGVTLNNVNNYIPGYERADGSTSKSCDVGAACTIISVKGYNTACTDLGNFGTIEREVVLEY